MYIKLINDVPKNYTLQQLRRDNPDVSFSYNPTNESLAQWNVYPLKPIAQPSYDSFTQKIEETTAINIGGEWVQQWQIVELSEEELAEKIQILKQDIIQQTQNRLDQFANTKNYDNIVSLCSYSTSTDPEFKADGERGVELRDATWRKLYEILAEVEAGTRPAPTSFTDIESELPELSWSWT